MVLVMVAVPLVTLSLGSRGRDAIHGRIRGLGEAPRFRPPGAGGTPFGLVWGGGGLRFRALGIGESIDLVSLDLVSPHGTALAAIGVRQVHVYVHRRWASASAVVHVQERSAGAVGREVADAIAAYLREHLAPERVVFGAKAPDRDLLGDWRTGWE